MKHLHALMNGFHTAILTKNVTAFAPQLATNPRLSPETQMAIYIDGYRIRLSEALRSDYPATLYALDQKAFDTLALHYIESTPPTHVSMEYYPYAFASFLRGKAGGFICDLALLESTIAELFTLPDSKPLNPSTLAAITPEQFAQLTLAPRTASRLLALDYPVNDYLIAERAGATPLQPQPQRCYLYIVRHHNEVRRHALSETEYCVLQTLRNQLSVGDALEVAVTAHPDIAGHLQPWFARWTEEGFFAAP